jgi:membrane protein YdbS with pleckstrin-like domain
MKVTKIEWIWLIVTAVLYIAYNLPGVPAYNQPVATMIHAALTVLPIWVVTYIFLPKVYRVYKLREEEKKEDK